MPTVFARASCVALLFALLAPATVRAETRVTGRVVDATTGLPLAGARVSIERSTVSVRTDAAGRFEFSAPSAAVTIDISCDGYEEARSVLNDGGAVVLALHRSSGNPTQIAQITSSAAASLAQSTLNERTFDAQLLLRTGTTRAADALRTLPALQNGITGDTAALGDDVNLSFRGIGTLETTAALDGHPIGYGVPGGYNFQLSPTFALRGISALYGSSGDAVGLYAIGGVVNMETLEPTHHNVTAFRQGFGSFERLATSFSQTGTRGKFGYAVAGGTSGLDGPFRRATFYQPGAAYDVSAPVGSSVYNLGVYTDDSGVTSRSLLLKARYAWNAAWSVGATFVSSNYWENKTGNGDGDYLPYQTALAYGVQNLAKYSGSTCPSGTFLATNQYGAPNGFGPTGAPDGGLTCQTPQQYAAFNTGWQGAGPALQTLRLNDGTLSLSHATNANRMTVDAYTSTYQDTIDRQSMLPFVASPGDSGFFYQTSVSTSGLTIRDRVLGTSNDLEAGLTYANNAYSNAFITNASSSIGTPVVHENGVFVRDVYHPDGSRWFGNATLVSKAASATHSHFIDTRVSALYRASSRDVVRASYGATTTQPSSDMIGQPFTPADLSGAGGGTPFLCGTLNSIGTAPSSVLAPERGTDYEAAYAHRFSGQGQIQVTLYRTNIYDKIYSALIPLSESGTSFIPASVLSNAQSIANKNCGTSQGLLGVTGNFNLGTMRSQGFNVGGRYRLTRQLFLDGEYAVTSTVIAQAAPEIFQSNLTLIPQAQVPHVPLQSYWVAVDATSGIWNGRLTLHGWGTNNSKALPAYTSTDLSVSRAAGRGVVTATVSNLFNQWATIAGLRGVGVPLALNAYAPAAAYAPLIGAGATEQFGLPFRQIYFNCEIKI